MGNESLDHNKLQNVQEVRGRGHSKVWREGRENSESILGRSTSHAHTVSSKRNVQRPSVTLVCLPQSTFLWLMVSR